MKNIILLILLSTALSSAAYGNDFSCFTHANKTRTVTQQVGRELNEDYYKSFLEIHPTMKKIKLQDFTDKHKFSHIICRIAGCTRATALKTQKLARRADDGAYSEVIESVTCSAKAKGSWNTPRLNTAFSRYRKHLPTLEKARTSSFKNLSNRAPVFEGLDDIIGAEEPGSIE